MITYKLNISISKCHTPSPECKHTITLAPTHHYISQKTSSLLSVFHREAVWLQCQEPAGDMGVRVFHAAQPLQGGLQHKVSPKEIIPQSVQGPLHGKALQLHCCVPRLQWEQFAADEDKCLPPLEAPLDCEGQPEIWTLEHWIIAQRLLQVLEGPLLLHPSQLPQRPASPPPCS